MSNRCSTNSNNVFAFAVDRDFFFLLVKDGKSEIHFPSSDLKVVKGKLNSRPSRHDVYTITENITGAIFYILQKKKKIKK